jgi:hypothetical protein
MNFEDQFSQWIDESLAGDIPESVKAFCFNLFEPAEIPGVKFGVELIGADRFDEGDPNWPCYEVWEPEPRWIPIPETYSGAAWEAALEKIRALLVAKLSTASASVERLKASEGVAVGFIDGDLDVIWKPDGRRPSG